MSDEPNETGDEPVETPAAETQQAQPAEAGDDLGALKRALEHEREERRQAKEELRRIREDEAARADLLKEWGYEVADEADTSEEDDFDVEPDDEIAKRLEAIEQREKDREDAAREAAFNRDLDTLAAEAELELDDFDREWIAATAAKDSKGFNQESVKRAVTARKEWYEQRDQAAIERFRGSKKAPHVTPAGKPATQVPDLDDRSQRQAWIAAEMAKRAS